MEFEKVKSPEVSTNQLNLGNHPKYHQYQQDIPVGDVYKPYKDSPSLEDDGLHLKRGLYQPQRIHKTGIFTYT